ETEVLAPGPAHLLQLLDRLRSVDLGLPLAEQVEVRAVEHEDLQAADTACIALESSREPTLAVTTGSPSPLSSTHRIPPRYFLSIDHALSIAAGSKAAVTGSPSDA